MLKNLASLLLSLLICLSLLPGQAGAADTTEGAPPVRTEASESAQPDDPDAPDEMEVLAAGEYPGEGGADHSED